MSNNTIDINKMAKEHEKCGKPFCPLCYHKSNLGIQEVIDTLNEKRRTEDKENR